MSEHPSYPSLTLPLQVRFSEVDSMHIVWHGHYIRYFEDAREAFGRQYDLEYMTIYNQGFYAPLVDVSVSYKRPITYGMHPLVTITYQPSDAAKIIFDYAITDADSGQLLATGHSVQVFLDLEHQLVWLPPQFYLDWKAQHLNSSDSHV